ncbi:helix-turn-helix domain-containing protein [Actinoplanes missouriensis]|uniref:helix-turn-helix domain-containing protein n=1 Tax=Actinoplanes missouriensis TaxID=1866 RepID=UPI0034101969
MTPRLPADATIGSRIRARRLLRGWSIRYASSRAGISHTTWSRIERGLLAADNRFMLAGLAAALDCSPAELAGVPVPITDRAVVAAHAAVHAVRQSLVELDLSEPRPSRAAPLPPGADPAFSAADPEPPEAADPELPEAADPELLAAGRRLGRPVAELARGAALLDDLRQSCDYAGAARLLPGLLRDLHAATTGPERLPALRLLCDVTFIASSVLRNLGHPADAWLGAERCRDAAAAAGDPVLLAYAAYARASAAAACGSFDRGLALAAGAADDVASHTARPGGLVVLGSLQLLCAFASRGQGRLDDSRAWSAEAAALADRTGETTTMGLYFGPANVGFWRIGIEVDGGDPGVAVEIARRTDPAILPAGFRQVFYYADTARALARLRGHDREAIRYLLIAERVAPQHVHTSPLARETTRALLDRSRRPAGGTELRALCERLQIA